LDILRDNLCGRFIVYPFGRCPHTAHSLPILRYGQPLEVCPGWRLRDRIHWLIVHLWLQSLVSFCRVLTILNDKLNGLSPTLLTFSYQYLQVPFPPCHTIIFLHNDDPHWILNSVVIILIPRGPQPTGSK
jgi:hypothetical protein